MKQTVYMDYNATAPIFASVVDAMTGVLRHVGNPSSVHRVGREARALMEDARETVAAKLNVPADWVIFTSGGTEADVLALNGTSRTRVLACATDHAAVLKARTDIEILPVDENGLLDLTCLEEALKTGGDDCLVSVAAANNETGVLQPLSEIVALAHRYGALVHSDAVQMVGKLPFDMQALDLDMVSLSAHKVGGPQGIGALVCRDGIKLDAILKGGGQERSQRGGTENLAGIVGFAAALREDVDMARVRELRDSLEEQVVALGAQVFAKDVERLPNTSYFAFRGITSERQIMALDLADVMVSAGSACSSGKVKASHVLKAMGIDEELAGCAIRVSLGWNSSKEDLDLFVKAWQKLVARVQARQSTRSDAA